MSSKDDDLVEILDIMHQTGLPGRADTLERPRQTAPLPKTVTCTYNRDLTEADIEALSVPRGQAFPRSLVTIRASHHSLARCIAMGMRSAQTSLITGYSPGRISALQRDPAFIALVNDYKTEQKSVFGDLAERMNNMSLDAMEILQERLTDNPESFSVPILLDLVKTFADRTGHGPNQNVTLRVSDNLIDRPPRENFEQWRARRDQEIGSKRIEADRTDEGPKVLQLPDRTKMN